MEPDDVVELLGLDEGTEVILGTISKPRHHRTPEDIQHLARLSLPVLTRILEDTRRVDLEISHADLPRHVDGVLKGSRKNVGGEAFPSVSLVGRLCRPRVISCPTWRPSVAECNIFGRRAQG
jgi:hypothetical protein